MEKTTNKPHNNLQNYFKTGTQPSNSQDTSAEYENLLRVFRKPVHSNVDASKRTQLIMEANKIMNSGDIEKAHTIFSALNYYDGMVRVAKEYHKSGKILESFAVFSHAGATKEKEELGKKIAAQMQKMMQS